MSKHMMKKGLHRGLIIVSAMTMMSTPVFAAINYDVDINESVVADETVSETSESTEASESETTESNFVDENGNVVEINQTDGTESESAGYMSDANILDDAQKAEIDRLIQERAETDGFKGSVPVNKYKPVLMLGADLSDAERQKVLELFGLSNTNDIETIELYHEDEVNILSGIIDEAQLGAKAVSSVYITPLPSGSGISVGTVNIDYVTNETIYNILITAGARDVEVKIVAPYKVSGTAAMVGVLRAYAAMSDTELGDEIVGLAMKQSALLDTLGKKYGAEEIEKIFSGIREKALDSSNTNVNSLKEIIRTLGLIHNVEFTEDELNKLADLVATLTQLSIDRANANNSEAKYIVEKDFKSEVDYLSDVACTKSLNWLFNDSMELPEKKEAKQVKVDNVFDGIETSTGEAKKAPVDSNEQAKAEILKKLTEETAESVEETVEGAGETTESTESAG